MIRQVRQILISLILKMRQDMQERERQVKRLHESIQKYKISPRTQKNIQKARIDLEDAIEDKYRRSEINRNYVFPRFSDEFEDQQERQINEIVNLHDSNDFLSHDLSIAEEPQKNPVYISEKTMLEYEKNSTFQNEEQPFKLKIKLFKKRSNKDERTIRIKTDYVGEKQYSTFNKNTCKAVNWSKNPLGESSSTQYFMKSHNSKHNKSLTRFQNSHSPFQSDFQFQELKTPKKDLGILATKTHSKINEKYYISQANKTHKDAIKTSKSRINISMKTNHARSLFSRGKQNPQICHTEIQAQTKGKKENIKIIKLGTSSQKRKARHII